MNIDSVDRIQSTVRAERLLDTAVRLIEVPSPTGEGTAVADCLAGLLNHDGFDVERPEAAWPKAPAVVARWKTGRPGRTLQFNGHLDTVHLPFVPPRFENGTLYGSGASDMKGGVAAMVEALRALRDGNLLPAGGILLTAHDLHESPWGDGRQLDALIDAGYVGDGVLLPEYLHDFLPVAGRGLAVIQVRITRPGQPVHEVLGGIDQPSVIRAGAELVRRLGELDQRLAQRRHALAGRESVFVGQVGAGEIYNQSPTEFRLSGTRRWIPGTAIADVKRQYLDLLAEVQCDTGTTVKGEFLLCRDAFELDREHTLVHAFQSACRAVMGHTLPSGAKPFVDDGNSFIARGKVAAVTHGPKASGAHTVHEQVALDELVRTAVVYAATAIAFCAADVKNH